MTISRKLGLIVIIVFATYMALVVKTYVVEHSRMHPESRTIGRAPASFTDLLGRFRDLAKAKGSVYAFEVLREADLPVDTDIHLIAHEIGTQLYAEKGIDGMSVCTQEFRNGCSHAIVIEALQELGDGTSVRKLIDDACHKAPGGASAYSMCYHGLGHGVFAYYGYSLPKTVSFCEKMGTRAYNNIQSQECIGGAVMELVSGGGHDKEQWQKAYDTYLDPDDLLAPCDTSLIPDDAKPSCYVYMTPYYMAQNGANVVTFTDDQLTRSMAVCDALPPGRDRSACIGAFGKDFPHNVGGRDVRKMDTGAFSDNQLKAIENLCLHAPEVDDAHVCESYALSTLFWGGDAEPTVSVRFCKLLSDEVSRDFCFNDLVTSIQRYFPAGEIRTERCALLDDTYHDACSASESS